MRDVEDVFTFIAIGAFATIFLWIVVRAIKHGGLKAAFFGASVKRTVGEISPDYSTLGRNTIRVHALDGSKASCAVAIELVSKTFTSYSMTPITLSREDARRLAVLLEQAAA
ncbi:hypothetical protein [Luteimonas vadosa]|uniref:DUF3592 domain-containing protein n=1 Tax=Luteimonas vadosa TaxID=1165507 RepID=A0ABP9DXS3_9GAMM